MIIIKLNYVRTLQINEMTFSFSDIKYCAFLCIQVRKTLSKHIQTTSPSFMHQSLYINYSLRIEEVILYIYLYKEIKKLLNYSSQVVYDCIESLTSKYLRNFGRIKIQLL